MSSPAIDYSAIADQVRQKSATSASSPVDYAALADQVRSTHFQPPSGTASDTKSTLEQKYPQYMQDQGSAAGRFLGGVWDAASGVAKRALGTEELGNIGTDVMQGNLGKAALGAANYAVKGPQGRVADAVIGSHVNEFNQAVDYAKQGRYSEAAGHGLAALTPGVGPMAADIAETAVGEPASPRQVGPTRAPNVAGALGKAVVGAAGAALGAGEGTAVGKVVGKAKSAVGDMATAASKKVFPVDWHDSLMRGIKPGNSNLRFADDLHLAVPEMKVAAEMQTGPIEDVDSALAAAQQAKRNIWQQYEQAAGPAKARNTQVDLSPIAEARIAGISPKFEFENPEGAQAIRDSAAKYRTQVPLETAESYLATTNAELRAYYAKFPLAQRAALASDPYVAGLEGEARAYRDAIYKSIDPEGEGAAPAELKRRYGALMNIEDQLQRRSNVAARQQPDNLMEQAGKVGAGLQMGRGLIKGLTHNPVGAAVDIGGALAARAAAKYVKEQQTTNALIKKGFDNYSGPTPAPVSMPTAAPPAGLLGPGSVRMPAAPDSSGPIPPTVPQGLRVRNEGIPPERQLPAPTIKMPGEAPPPPVSPMEEPSGINVSTARWVTDPTAPSGGYYTTESAPPGQSPGTLPPARSLPPPPQQMQPVGGDPLAAPQMRVTNAMPIVDPETGEIVSYSSESQTPQTRFRTTDAPSAARNFGQVIAKANRPAEAPAMREGVLNGRRVALQEDGNPAMYLDEAPGQQVRQPEARPIVRQEDNAPLAYAEPVAPAAAGDILNPSNVSPEHAATGSTPSAIGQVPGESAGAQAAQPAAGVEGGGQGQANNGANPASFDASSPATTEVLIPGEGRSFPAQYKVRELVDIQASHNGNTFQPNPKYSLKNDRTYTSSSDRNKVASQSTKGLFKPSLHITDNPDAANGPILIDSQGNALGGNGRTMQLHRVYAADPKDAFGYRSLLMKKAAQYGQDPQAIAQMKQPVLVREISDQDIVNKGHAITDFNKTGTAALKPSEQAISDSRRVSLGTLNDLSARLDEAGEGTTLAQLLQGKNGTEVLDKLIDDGVITPQQRAAYAKDDVLTKDGQTRISKLLLGRFFRDPAQLDTISPKITNKIERSAANLASIDNPETGEWNITPKIHQAMDLIEETRAQGYKGIDNYLKQGGLLGQEFPPDVVTMAKRFQQIPTRELTEALARYAEDAREYSAPPSLFARPTEPPTPAEALEQAFEYAKTQKAARDAAKLAAESAPPAPARPVFGQPISGRMPPP